MSEITWAELTEFEQGHLKSFNNDPHAVSARRSSQSLETKGLIKWGWETGYALTDLGRAVLAQADAKPTTITAAEFVANGYAAKIAARECVVKSILYTKFEVVSVEQIKPNSDGWDVAITDTKSTYRTWSNAKLTVTWLPQAEAKHDSGATGAKNTQVEAGEFLPPITRHDDETWCEKGYNNGYEAAAKIAREQYNLANYWADKNAELMTELASAKAEAGRLRTALEEIRDFDVRYELGYVDEWQEAEAFARVQRTAAEALQAGTEGG